MAIYKQGRIDEKPEILIGTLVCEDCKTSAPLFSSDKDDDKGEDEEHICPVCGAHMILTPIENKE